MTLTEFKTKYQNAIFAALVKPYSVTILQFDDHADLGRYIFTDAVLRERLYHKMASRPDLQALLLGNAQEEMDVDEIEKLLHNHADKLNLLEVIGYDENAIIIDTIDLDATFWQELNDSESGLYTQSANPVLAYDKISKFISGEQ